MKVIIWFGSLDHREQYAFNLLSLCTANYGCLSTFKRTSSLLENCAWGVIKNCSVSKGEQWLVKKVWVIANQFENVLGFWADYVVHLLRVLSYPSLTEIYVDQIRFLSYWHNCILGQFQPFRLVQICFWSIQFCGFGLHAVLWNMVSWNWP